MLLSDFDFTLPEEQIAQTPLPTRDASRLMTLSRATGAYAHRTFQELPGLLRRGDLLVVNDARVVPARLLGKKAGTGGRAELLLVRPASNVSAGEALAQRPDALEWICIGQASKGFKAGAQVELAGGLTAEILERLGEGEYRVRFRADQGVALAGALEAAGRLPLPPYISREPTAADRERYQTVYARAAGSVAAPTAGLHFTPELFARLAERGVEKVAVTLDVGPGTFLPVRVDRVADHRMHPERYEVSAATADAVNTARREGRRLVAVGTTVVRTLEAATDAATGLLRSGPGETSIFITPGYTYRQVDALITNFHLPRSTLLMLVSAFAGREHTLAAYRAAVEAKYRFFSYGDAMLIAD